MFEKTNGVTPNASTGPLGEFEWTVIKSVAMLLVIRKVVPATALLRVEYSPAKGQVEMVTNAPDGLILALPKAFEFVHWAFPIKLISKKPIMNKIVFFINVVN